MKTTTHDYTNCYWRHSYVIINIKKKGQRISMMGWGHGLKVNDFILFENKGATTRYKLTKVEYETDPHDMWHAEAQFAPRSL